METLRRYVFPLVWMVILAVIALALVKIAFFPSTASGAQEDPVFPEATVDAYATVPVQRGDVSSSLELDAVITPDPGTALKANASGDITKIWAPNGTKVAKGDRILQVRVEEGASLPEPAEPADPTAPEAADGADAAPAPEPAAPAPQYRYINLYAPADGTVRGLEVEEWDSIGQGDGLGSISPGTYSAVASLTPEQQLSLLDIKLKATLTLPGSDEPLTCKDPSIAEDTEVDPDKATESPSEEELYGPDGMPVDSGSDVSAAQIVCPVPQDAKVVPALTVPMMVNLGSAHDVLLAPATAVVGEGTSGQVFVLDDATGAPAPVDVTLGKRDDGMVEITEGLEEGQEILEFAPGVDSPEDPMGGMW